MQWDYQKILNAQFKTSYLDSIPAFKDNYKNNTKSVRRVLFQANERFVRVITRGSNYGISAEYLTERSFAEIVARSRDYELGEWFIQQWRKDAAVKKSWNPSPNMALTYRLQQPAYGLVGVINWQWEESESSDDGRKGWYSAGKVEQVLFPHLSKKFEDNLGENEKKRLDFLYDGSCASMVICGHKTLGSFIPNASLKTG